MRCLQLTHRVSNAIMLKKFLFTLLMSLAIIPFIFLCSACSSSDDPVCPDKPADADKYFFKYEVTCSSDSANTIKKLYVITDRENTITQMPEGKKTELEATYGPVEKGYHIGLSCNDEDEKTHSNFHVRISVKKNDNPFVLIKEDYGSDVTLMYVIN